MRGLKSLYMLIQWQEQGVALYMSAWIEICCEQANSWIRTVALYMSAWIEIVARQLKYRSEPVALYMSAWIEML